MPPAPRHSRPKTPRKPAIKIGVPVLAAATLAGVAAAFVFLTGGSAGSAAATSPSPSKISVASSASSLTSDDMMIDIHHQVAARTVRNTARTIRRHYLARLAAARLAQKQAAEQAAKQAGSRRRPARPSRLQARARRPAPRAARMPLTPRSESASATPKRAAATRGDPVTAAGLTSSCWEPGKITAARPASSAWPALLTRTRSSITPSRPEVPRTGGIRRVLKARRLSWRWPHLRASRPRALNRQSARAAGADCVMVAGSPTATRPGGPVPVRPGRATSRPAPTPEGDGIVLGDGPVQVDAFIDFLCPYCQRFELSSGPALGHHAGRAREQPGLPSDELPGSGLDDTLLDPRGRGVGLRRRLRPVPGVRARLVRQPAPRGQCGAERLRARRPRRRGRAAAKPFAGCLGEGLYLDWPPW